jgi:hypothetical protein
MVGMGDFKIKSAYFGKDCSICMLCNWVPNLVTAERYAFVFVSLFKANDVAMRPAVKILFGTPNTPHSSCGVVLSTYH